MTIDQDLRARIMAAKSVDDLSPEDAARLWCVIMGRPFSRIVQGIVVSDRESPHPDSHGERLEMVDLEREAVVRRNLKSLDYLYARAKELGYGFGVNSGCTKRGYCLPAGARLCRAEGGALVAEIDHDFDPCLAASLALADAQENSHE